MLRFVGLIAKHLKQHQVILRCRPVGIALQIIRQDLRVLLSNPWGGFGRFDGLSFGHSRIVLGHADRGVAEEGACGFQADCFANFGCCGVANLSRGPFGYFCPFSGSLNRLTVAIGMVVAILLLLVVELAFLVVQRSGPFFTTSGAMPFV